MSNDAPQNPDNFQANWLRFHGGLPPLAHVLRNAEQTPWVRFHALPNSKRYSENAAERQEILERANTLGTDILASSPDCWLVQCRAEGEPISAPSVSLIKPDASFRFSDPEDGEMQWIAVLASVRWQNGSLDDLLMAIADDQTGPTLLMNGGNGAIFAPYDGGFDLFPASLDEVKRLKGRYADWLSSHPRGL
jgi:hypothetical protein